MSLAKIAISIGAAKSTVSLWLREFPLTQEEMAKAKAIRVEPPLQASCSICGRVFKTYRDNAKYCSKRCQRKGDPNRNIRIISATRRKRVKIKERAIECKGGKCVICGYNRCHRALKFHHIDPTVKDFEVSRGVKSWETIRAELDKCILVCGNCHDEIHAGITVIPD
jgi:hypothetical protein